MSSLVTSSPLSAAAALVSQQRSPRRCLSSNNLGRLILQRPNVLAEKDNCDDGAFLLPEAAAQQAETTVSTSMSAQVNAGK